MRHRHCLMAIALAASLLALAGCTSGATGGSMRNDSAATQRQEAARVHTDLGRRYMQQGKLEIALEKLNKALSFDPGYVDAHTVIAFLFESIGDSAKAEQHYKRAAELKPKGGSENNNYGRFLCATGRYADAQVYFDKALTDPFYKTPGLALANSGTCLLKAGKPVEAEKALRLAVEHNPNDGEALYQLASVLYEQGDFFNARAFVQRFESHSQPRPDALLLGRNIELRLGNGQAAKDYTHKLLQGFPESQQARSLNVQG